MRAFVNWIIDSYNAKTGKNLGILLVTPIERDNYTAWQGQEGLYFVLTKGLRNGKILDESYLVKSVSRILHIHPRWEDYLRSAENPEMRYVISNTTEAGIRYSSDDRMADNPPNEFPAKLTRWLYHRYQYFNGEDSAGCVFIPVELILDNGKALRECVLQNATHWGLPEGFKKWVVEANTFCNTLVDRIVPGVAPDARSAEWEKIGYQDEMITQGEPFHFWAIEAPPSVRKELPLDKIGLDIVFTDDLTPYRTRKVRILNGAHTAMVPVGYLYGIRTVRETVEDETMGKYVDQVIFEEIIPTLDLPEEELMQFARDVIDRFKNPFIRHELISISLNSISKFKTRVLPSLLEFEKRKGALPEGLVLSFAALIRFYKGTFDGEHIPLNDDAEALAFMDGLWDKCDGSEQALYRLVEQVLKWEKAWETDLSKVPGLAEKVTAYLMQIEKAGMQETVKMVLK